MINKKITQLSVTVAMLMAGGAAQAASWTAGEWELGLGGNINAHFISTSCSASDLQSGAGTLAAAACAGALDENGAPTNAQTIQNGLLPTSLNFSAKTTQDGWNIGANINVYYGLNSNAAAGSADSVVPNSTIDPRQIFFTAGKEGGGVFKAGRDFGLFGLDAVLNDISLVGVGAGFSAGEPAATTLGGLGYGYVYTDRLSQINYTTADMSGLKLTGGLFSGFDGNGAASSGEIGIHAKVSYTQGSVTVSSSFLTQAVAAGGTSQDIKGFDLFAKVNMGDIDLVGYLFDGEGMSTLAIGGLLSPGFGAGGTPEEVSGYMLQASMKTSPELKLGINLSHSEQDKVTIVENDRMTLGGYYSLTKSLTLIGEFNTLESKTPAGSDEVTSINVGAFLGF